MSHVRTARQQRRRNALLDFMMEDIRDTPPEELLAEALEDGTDIEAVQLRFQDARERAIAQWEAEQAAKRRPRPRFLWRGMLAGPGRSSLRLAVAAAVVLIIAIGTVSVLRLIEHKPALTAAEELVQAKGAYAKGDGQKAFAWTRKAVDQGNAHAQTTLAIMYANGLGVSQSLTDAAVWFRKAAEQGDMLAQTNLAMMYAGGLGVPRSASQAGDLFRQAAEQGDVRARTNLGALYATDLTFANGVTNEVASTVPGTSDAGTLPRAGQPLSEQLLLKSALQDDVRARIILGLTQLTSRLMNLDAARKNYEMARRSVSPQDKSQLAALHVLECAIRLYEPITDFPENARNDAVGSPKLRRETEKISRNRQLMEALKSFALLEGVPADIPDLGSAQDDENITLAVRTLSYQKLSKEPKF